MLELLPTLVWENALVFARLAAILMVAPVYGETYVPAQYRLGFALLTTLALVPTLSGNLPPLPATPIGASIGVVREVLVGLAIGSGARLIMAALSTAGNIVGLMTGMAFAQQVDPTQGQMNASFSAFLSLLGLTLIVATDTHHLLLQGAASSYEVFAPLAPLSPGDWSEQAVRWVSESFALAMRICAPLIVLSIAMQVGTALANRMAPGIQLFFIITPLTVLAGLMVFMISLGAGGLVFLEVFTRSIP